MIGMENDNKPVSQDNWGQIIRKDAKGCFVEVRNDTFHLDKVHLQFVSYDTTKPKGSRYVNNISIYIDVPEFLALAQEAASGTLHMRMQQYKNAGNTHALRAVPGAGPGALVCAARGGGHHLQARQAVHRQGAAHAQFPAGTGKTEGARAIAAGLNLPYMKYTCSAGTEIYDLIGQVFPDTDGPSTGDAELDQQRAQLKEMGGITYENVKKLMGLPDLDDMDYDPAGTYQKLTGVEKADATSQDCMGLVMELVTDKLQQLCKVKPESADGRQTYSYIETDFIRALKHGYLVELQEPTTIIQPGVLVGLNSLLEQGGSITLPTGEVIHRHPDAVVVVTTNVSYEGCRGVNQSVLDRMNLTQDIELPAPEIMAQRAMSITGCEDDVLVGRMVQVVTDMADYCRKNGISDGNCGMRSLIDWIMSTEITGDPYSSALYTIVSKATSDEEDRDALKATVLEPIFAPKRKKAV